MDTIAWPDFRKIVVLTGAGISVASGLRSYRGPDGLWTDDEAVRYAMVETWRSDPLGVWQRFGAMRSAVASAAPNDAHGALAALPRRLSPDAELHIVTQNVDGLHQAAGSANVIELHGSLHRTRCDNTECEFVSFVDERTHFDSIPTCHLCGSHLRPDIVLFGELLPYEAEHLAKRALRGCDLFIAIGTSGTVTPAANFVRSADFEGARTVLLNLEPMEPRNPYFQEEILGRAEEILPELVGA